MTSTFLENRGVLGAGRAGCRWSPKLLRVTGVMHNDQSQGRYRTSGDPSADLSPPGSQATLPAVSVVMPVLNEERHLAESVAAVLGQDYPGGFELVLAIGPSKDRTDAIARGLAAADRRITVVPNPSGRTPSAQRRHRRPPTRS